MDGFPKVKYHIKGGGSICVVSAAQEKALGQEWLDNKPPSPVTELSKPQIVSETPQKKRGRPKAAGGSA